MAKVLVFFFIGSLTFGQALSQAPRDIETRVVDQARVLTDSEKRELYKQIKSLEDTVGSQIAIKIVRSLNGRKLNEVSIQTAEAMKLGRREIHDGILLFIAIDENVLRIEVGFGLERIVKDEIASQIIKEQIIPYFRQAEYFEGISAGVKKIALLIISQRNEIGK